MGTTDMDFDHNRRPFRRRSKTWPQLSRPESLQFSDVNCVVNGCKVPSLSSLTSWSNDIGRPYSGNIKELVQYTTEQLVDSMADTMKLGGNNAFLGVNKTSPIGQLSPAASHIQLNNEHNLSSLESFQPPSETGAAIMTAFNNVAKVIATDHSYSLTNLSPVLFTITSMDISSSTTVSTPNYSPQHQHTVHSTTAQNKDMEIDESQGPPTVGLNIFIEYESYLRNRGKVVAECPYRDHRCDRRDIYVNELNQLTSNDIDLSKVQSIWLSGVIAQNIMRTILDNCPQLFCLHINSATFEPGAINLLKNEAAPKLKHLSSNGSIRSSVSNTENYLHEFIQNCHIIEDWKVTIYSVDNFDRNCLRDVSETLKFLHWNDERTSKTLDQSERAFRTLDLSQPSLRTQSIPLSETNDNLVNYMESLLKSINRSGLEYLRIEDNDKVNPPYQSLMYISMFPNLRALNISVRNKIDDNNRGYYYAHYGEMFKLCHLESLTVKIAHDTSEFLEMICISPRFREVLRRFRLINGRIQWNFIGFEPFNKLLRTFPNLESLQLIDCVFLESDINLIITRISQMLYLNQLYIENHDPNDYMDNNGENGENGNFKVLSIDNFETIIRQCRPLNDFTLVNPMLTTEEIQSLRELALQRGISEFYCNHIQYIP